MNTILIIIHITLDYLYTFLYLTQIVSKIVTIKAIVKKMCAFIVTSTKYTECYQLLFKCKSLNKRTIKIEI